MDLQAILPKVERTLWAARDHGGRALYEVGAIGRVALEQMGVRQAVADKVAELWNKCPPRVHTVAGAFRWVFEMTPQELVAAQIRQGGNSQSEDTMRMRVSHNGICEEGVLVSDSENRCTKQEMPRWKMEDVKKCAARALTVYVALWAGAKASRLVW